MTRREDLQNLTVVLILLLVVPAVFNLHFLGRYPRAYIRGNSYIDRKYNVGFEFPKGWHAEANKIKGTNVLGVVHKAFWNDYDAAANKDKSLFYPLILLTAYNVKKGENDLSQIVDRILKQEFSPSYAGHYKITHEQIVKRDHYDVCEVTMEMHHAQRGLIKNEGVFIRKKNVLFWLSFSDEAANFDRNIGSFTIAKESFQVSGWRLFAYEYLNARLSSHPSKK